MFNFVKFPNKLFYSLEGDKKSILQQINDIKLINGDKVLSILEYLYFSVNRKDIIKFTLEDMIISCGNKPKTGQGKCNEQYQIILSKLQELHIISFAKGLNINKIKPKDLITCKFNDYIETVTDKETGEITDSFYIELFDTEKDKIINYNKEKIDNLKLLIYYCYLKARIYKRSAKELPLNAGGGRSETCFLKYNKINDDLGLSDKSIKKYNDILISLNLIRIKNPGHWHYADDELINKKESPNFFTLFNNDEEDAKHQLNEAIKSYKNMEINKNKVFLGNREYKNNNRSLNGKKGRIVRKINEGKATNEDRKILEKILESTNPNFERKSIESILDAHEGEALSYIYQDIIGDDDKCEYYAKIEDLLGLYNDDTDTITVDWKYYRWVMLEYFYGEHKGDVKFCQNCVSKYIREQKPKKHLRLNKPEPIVEVQPIEDDWGSDNSDNYEIDIDEDISEEDITKAIDNCSDDGEDNYNINEAINDLDEVIAEDKTLVVKTSISNKKSNNDEILNRKPPMPKKEIEYLNNHMFEGYPTNPADYPEESNPLDHYLEFNKIQQDKINEINQYKKKTVGWDD